MNKFEEVCESFGIIKQTKRIMYPKQISFSEEFKQALKNEYYRLTLEEDNEHPIKNRPEKFLKALQFHVADLERNKEAEIATIRAMMDENTDDYKATVKGEKKEGCKGPCNKKECSCNKKENQRRKEIEKENIEPIKESVEAIYESMLNEDNDKVIKSLINVINNLIEKSQFSKAKESLMALKNMKLGGMSVLAMPQYKDIFKELEAKLGSNISSYQSAKDAEEAARKAADSPEAILAAAQKCDFTNAELGTANGWSDEASKIYSKVIELHSACREKDPEKHKTVTRYPFGRNRGYEVVSCPCGYGYAVDSSD